MFCDITWGAGGSTADLTLDIATKMQNMARAAHPARRGVRSPLASRVGRRGRLARPDAPRRPDLRGDDDAPHVHQHAARVAQGRARQGTPPRSPTHGSPHPLARACVRAHALRSARAGQGGGHPEHSGASRRPAQGRHVIRGCRGRLFVRARPREVHPRAVWRLLRRHRGRIPRGAPRRHQGRPRGAGQGAAAARARAHLRCDRVRRLCGGAEAASPAAQAYAADLAYLKQKVDAGGCVPPARAPSLAVPESRKSSCCGPCSRLIPCLATSPARW